MNKQTVIDQIEILRDGTINVRMAKEVVDDDGTVIASAWHRTSFPPGHDIDAQMAAVSKNLVDDLGYPAIQNSCIARVKVASAAYWTPEIVAAHQAKLGREIEALAARSKAQKSR